MNNPTELPDLEAERERVRAAFENSDGYKSRLLFKRGGSVFAENVPEDEYVDSGVQGAWKFWQAAWAAARRAKPEGEAPQAKPVAWMVPIEGVYEYFATEQAARKEREAYEQEMSDDPNLEHVAPVPLYEHAASLSPLCGAQHAESGKEVKSQRDIALDLIHYESEDGHTLVRLDKVKELLAAQLDGGQKGSESNG